MSKGAEGGDNDADDSEAAKYSSWQSAFRRSFGGIGQGMTNKLGQREDFSRIFNENLSLEEETGDSKKEESVEGVKSNKMQDEDESLSDRPEERSSQLPDAKSKKKQRKDRAKMGRRKEEAMDECSSDEGDRLSAASDASRSSSRSLDEEDGERDMESKRARIAQLMQEIENLKKLKAQTIIEKKVEKLLPQDENGRTRRKESKIQRQDSMSLSDDDEDEDEDEEGDGEQEVNNNVDELDEELESLIQKETKPAGTASASLVSTNLYAVSTLTHAHQTMEDFVGTELPPPPIQEGDFKQQNPVQVVRCYDNGLEVRGI
eukprot:766693-Hanusia_phi.AAC.1